MATGYQQHAQCSIEPQHLIRTHATEVLPEGGAHTSRIWRCHDCRSSLCAIPGYSYVAMWKFGVVMIASNIKTEAGNYAVGLYSNVKEHVSSAGGTLYESASDVIHRTGDGWEKTRQDMELPQWLTGLFGNRGPSSGPEGGPNGPPPRQSRSGTAAAAVGVAGGAATAFSYDGDGDEDESVANEIARDDQMMLLTRKMIEIRNLLQSVEQSEALTLPSIVVVGSQSSGKSSVLEAIVGHEFLPKGSNMVTRRPIELTLINTPDSKTEYGEFIDMELGRITDFSQIRRTLTDLNLAVPDTECVSDNPIRLRICSAKVPDLSLIDLPGYIQVTGTDQPLELKEKISELCEKYIQPPNIILAISAADVDLANSTALRASRKVDPRGDRTIGVITKLDLVDPERAANILSDKMYALRLGYVGVVAQARQGIKNSLYRGDRNLTDDVMRNENAYFSAHPEVFGPQAAVDVGVGKLRKKLMRILEQTMASNLSITADAIQNELAETRYEFKVQYNERPLSAETYLAESLDAFKHSFKNFSQQFGRVEIRELLKHELDQQVLNVLAQRYWNKPVEDLLPSPQESDALTDLPKADPEDPLWHLKLDASVASLTKLGIGRLATTVVANAIQAHVNRLVTNSTFSSHPMAREAIADASSSIIRDLSYDTSSELEICIKPYKYRIEPEDHEWSKGRQNITTVLKEELRVCDQALKGLEGQVGGKRKLKDVMTFIDKVRTSQITLEGNGTGGAGGFSSALLHHGENYLAHLD